MIVVIRAGGVGTRLWPASRTANPKQFQALVGEAPLLRQTVERIVPLLDSPDHLFVSVNEQFIERVAELVPELPVGNLIVESESRNTGPAICLETAVLAERFPADTVVASIPSDDYIRDPEPFRDLLRAGEQFLATHPDYVVTPGARPWHVDTGYSYMRAGSNLLSAGEESIFELVDWVEKPDADRCKDLIASGLYYCHTGMYLWKLGTIGSLFDTLQPAMAAACREIVALRATGGTVGESADRYASLEKMTIETAITHRAPHVAMSVSNRMFWSDVGKWHLIKELVPDNDGDNLTKGVIVPYDTTDCLIYGSGEKVIATIGLNDCVIVDTSDALLICLKERSGEVSKVIDELKRRGLTRFL